MNDVVVALTSLFRRESNNHVADLLSGPVTTWNPTGRVTGNLERPGWPGGM